MGAETTPTDTPEATPAETPEPAPPQRPAPPPGTQFYGTGRRKTSVARVYLKAGEGKFQVNGRPFEVYFPTESQRGAVRQALQAVDMLGQFDAWITVRGGGVTAQAGAVRMGMARALLHVDTALRPQLKKLGFLTRDSRAKERKKYGQKGARKRFQFSKR